MLSTPLLLAASISTTSKMDPSSNPFADLALAAGVAVLGVQAVDRPGQDLGAGGLARPPRAGEQVGVGNAPPHHLVLQGEGHLGLAHHVGKELGPVFPVEHLVHGAASPSLKKAP